MECFSCIGMFVAATICALFHVAEQVEIEAHSNVHRFGYVLTKSQQKLTFLIASNLIRKAIARYNHHHDYQFVFHRSILCAFDRTIFDVDRCSLSSASPFGIPLSLNQRI